MFTSLKQRAVTRRTSREVYGSIVTQARHETFYREWGVPDTMEGRVEMIILHTALVLDRLSREGEGAMALGQAVTEAYIADIDDALRQIGTGDMGVPRRVKKAAAALRERRLAYGKALDSDNPDDLAGAVRGFVYPDAEGAPRQADAAAAFATYIRGVSADLAAVPQQALFSGAISFRAPEDRADVATATTERLP